MGYFRRALVFVWDNGARKGGGASISGFQVIFTSAGKICVLGEGLITKR